MNVEFLLVPVFLQLVAVLMHLGAIVQENITIGSTGSL